MLIQNCYSSFCTTTFFITFTNNCSEILYFRLNKIYKSNRIIYTILLSRTNFKCKLRRRKRTIKEKTTKCSIEQELRAKEKEAITQNLSQQLSTEKCINHIYKDTENKKYRNSQFNVRHCTYNAQYIFYYQQVLIFPTKIKYFWLLLWIVCGWLQSLD